MTSAELLTGLTLGLMGSGHCGAMCGGIAAALGSSAEGKQNYAKLFAFHAGRVTSYVLIALLFGSFLAVLKEHAPMVSMILRLVAGLLLVAMGLYIAGWWPGISMLEKAASPLWRKLQPMTKSLIPPANSGSALLLGGLWGWLPCGLVYSALAWSITAGSAPESALRMLSFGLGTLPAMLGLSFAANRLRHVLQHHMTRKLAGAMLLVFGCWTLVTPANMLGNNEKGHEHHHGGVTAFSTQRFV